jgi:hypothetical protein
MNEATASPTGVPVLDPNCVVDPVDLDRGVAGETSGVPEPDRGVVRAAAHAGPHRHPRRRGAAPFDRRVAEELIDQLPQIWPTPARETGVEPPPAADGLERDSEWAPDLERFDGVLANLPTLSDTDLDEAIAGLRALEREVSDERRALHDVIDRIDLSLAAQLR